MPKALLILNFHHINTIFNFQCVDMWKRSPCNLAIPSEVDVSQFMNCSCFNINFLN